MIEPIYGWESPDGNLLAFVVLDDMPINPRKWTGSTIYHWHETIDLGERIPYTDTEAARERFPGDVFIPVYLSERMEWVHLRAGYAGVGELVPQHNHIGWIVYPMEDLTGLEKYYGERALDVLADNANNEVKNLEGFLNGETFEYRIYEINTCTACNHTEMVNTVCFGSFYSVAAAREALFAANPEPWRELSDSQLRKLSRFL